MCQKVLQRSSIVLYGIQLSPIPFRLDNKWLKVESLRAMIEKCYVDTKVERKTSFRVEKKPKPLKDGIKRWVKEASIKEEEHTSRLLQDIDDFDKEGDGSLTLEESIRQEVLRLEFTNRINMKETSWRHKAREKWIKEGD